VSFKGTVDAQSFIERGGCVIGQGGALIVATTLQPIGVPYVTETGFQGARCRIPGIDEPWSFAVGVSDPRVDALISQLGAFSQQIAAIETALGNISGEGLSASDTEALRRLKAWLGI
jgi:hypothetical protein